MTLVTFSEAARLLGHKSRSQLYRWRDDGSIRAHLIPPAREGGPQLIETHPQGARPLLDLARALTRTQANSPALRADELEQRRAQLAERNRWAVAAGALSAALEAAGLSLQLSGPEARCIAAALPDALGEALGVAGVDALAADAAAARDRIEPPKGPADLLVSVDGSPGFWTEWGRIAGPDEPPLTDDEHWEHVWRIVAGMMDPDAYHCRDAGVLQEVDRQIEDAWQDVALGVRWDQARWDRANARSLLDGMPCELSAADLAQLLEAGRIPADLLAEVRAALSQMPATAAA